MSRTTVLGWWVDGRLGMVHPVSVRVYADGTRDSGAGVVVGH